MTRRCLESQQRQATAVDEGYTPPRTFGDFYTRYPNAIKMRLHRRWGLQGLDQEDFEHDVCVHLLSLPVDSIFKPRGCVDRIATYDAAKRGGGSERLFLGYIHLIIDNFYRSRVCRRSNQFNSKTFTIADLIGPDGSGDGIDEDTAMARLSDAFEVKDDPLPRIYWRQFLRRAAAVHPLLVTVADALVKHPTKSEAAVLLKMSLPRFDYIVRVLRVLAVDDRKALKRFRKLRKLRVPIRALVGTE
jgi:hypothetical protein